MKNQIYLSGDNTARKLINEEIAEPNKKTDVCVFIGRFQPLHKGHLKVMGEGLSMANLCVVVVGSANQSRTIRNPFTAEERIEMIRSAFPSQYGKTIIAVALEDSEYNINEWVRSVQKVVQDVSIRVLSRKPESTTLIGHKKDQTSYYLDLFPTWGCIDIPSDNALSATAIRMNIFNCVATNGDDRTVEETARAANAYIKSDTAWTMGSHSNIMRLNTHPLHETTVVHVQEFLKSPEYMDLVREMQFLCKYKSAWENSPYPPTFVTADAVVVQSGHVLLVKRNSYPGNGLWALPGGFVEQDESIENAAIRELKEETKIKVPPAVLRGSIVSRKVFDSPHRSSRGRTVTTAFLMCLSDGQLPKISKKENKEVRTVVWMPFSDMNRKDFFEDHYAIIKHMIALG